MFFSSDRYKAIKEVKAKATRSEVSNPENKKECISISIILGPPPSFLAASHSERALFALKIVYSKSTRA